MSAERLPRPFRKYTDDGDPKPGPAGLHPERAPRRLPHARTGRGIGPAAHPDRRRDLRPGRAEAMPVRCPRPLRRARDATASRRRDRRPGRIHPDMGTVPALAGQGGSRGTATHAGGAAGKYAPTGAANRAGLVTAPPAVLAPRACGARAADSIAARLREAQEPMCAGRFGQAGPNPRRVLRARPGERPQAASEARSGAGRFRAGRMSTRQCAFGRRTARRTRPCRAQRRHGRPRRRSAGRPLRWRGRPAAAVRRDRHGCRRARAIAWRSGRGRRQAAAAAVHQQVVATGTPCIWSFASFAGRRSASRAQGTSGQCGPCRRAGRSGAPREVGVEQPRSGLLTACGGTPSDSTKHRGSRPSAIPSAPRASRRARILRQVIAAGGAGEKPHKFNNSWNSNQHIWNFHDSPESKYSPSFEKCRTALNSFAPKGVQTR